MGDSWTRKLDAYSRRALAAGAENGLDVTVRLHDAAAAAQLVESGLQVHATIGELVVGHVADGATLIRLAELPAVAEVQASRTLHNEKKE
jgi:hypothetical protein